MNVDEKKSLTELKNLKLEKEEALHPTVGFKPILSKKYSQLGFREQSEKTFKCQIASGMIVEDNLLVQIRCESPRPSLQEDLSFRAKVRPNDELLAGFHEAPASLEIVDFSVAKSLNIAGDLLNIAYGPSCGDLELHG